MVCSFQATVAARGYHVYKNTMWDQAKVLAEIESDKKSIEIDPYCCSIKTSVNQQIKTVAHILREISRHVYFFLKDDHGHIDGTVKSIDYRSSPILVGGLEILLTLSFKCLRYITLTKMKEFMYTLYSLLQTRKNKKVPLKSESSKESQPDSEVANPKRKRKPTLINETPKLESDSEVVNPKRKTKPLLINEQQESDRFVIDEEYDIVIEK